MAINTAFFSAEITTALRQETPPSAAIEVPALTPADLAPRRVRSLFLSDIHLGTRACQADRLLDFLRQYDCDNLFLVGDIVDFWALKRGIYWPEAHNTVVQKILRRARHNVKVVYLPGNHDEALRDYIDSAFGDITAHRDYVHIGADGQPKILALAESTTA